MSQLKNASILDKDIFFDIKNIILKSRTEFELLSRFHSQSVYTGEDTILCRVLTKYMCYVDARDGSVTPHLCLHGYWESWVTQAMARIIDPGWICVDIGANCGYYSLLMADIVGSSGQVLSVEPNPILARLVEKSLVLNGFKDSTKVSCKAISDTSNKKVSLTIPGNAWGSASIRSDLGKWVSSDNEKVVEVETITFDELTLDCSRIDLVKIDAEGVEPEIWKGMKKTLKKNPEIRIIMEFAPDRYVEPTAFLEDIINEGFSIAFIDSDSTIKDLSMDEYLQANPGSYWDLFLQRR
jgi:FkbM family methyltransferase